MKILIVGDAGSIFVKQYIEYVLLDGKNEVILLQEGYVSPDYMEFYQKAQVRLEPLTMKKIGLL